ncbi:MFS transporter [Microvirga subterranea]|uniref:MFS transporter (Putative signal transducer) n=1 Tax=Microvirga subterranea TaxID=186651 RepID=A0A370HKZ7_9HYPH|nr:MFS transporter [Microvirga subterranea]RDI58835.1 MFS transporter (putative signal transducer) [Microvirga subterranea]
MTAGRPRGQGPQSQGLAAPAAIVLTLGGLYVGQSIISGLTFIALPSVLRDRGLPLDRIGLTYLAVLPWALKFLWAPAVERYRLPPTGPSRSRSIVVVGGLISALGLCIVGLIGPTHLVPVIVVFTAIAFAASTVDIACDGHAVERLSEPHHGWGNAAQVGGAYLGSAIGSGLFLVLVARLDWDTATCAMAALLLLLGVPFLLCSGGNAPALREHQPSLRHALGRREIRKGLCLAAIYVVAQKWALSMLGPFLIDSGVELASLGFINGVGGMIVGFACALLGGALVRVWGAASVMLLALVLQACTLAALAAAAWRGGVPQPLLVALALASSSGLMALGFVALYARFMALSDPRQAGIDFTLLQCMDALVSMAGGIGAGWVSQHLGYGACFGAAAAFAIIAAPVVSVLNRSNASQQLSNVLPATAKGL